MNLQRTPLIDQLRSWYWLVWMHSRQF